MNPLVQYEDHSPKNKSRHTDYHLMLVSKLGVVMVPFWCLIQPHNQSQGLPQYKRQLLNHLPHK